MNKKTITDAETYLSNQDPILGALIRSQKLQPLVLRGGYFESLCRSIIGQQVSVAAAVAIFTRFEEYTKLSPELVANLDEHAGKIIGLSRQKLGYLKDLALHFIEDPDIYNHLETQTDDEIIIELTTVKGIGVWTAQMFLIFTLARQDIFAPDDVGLQNAMKLLYNWETLPPKKELQAIAATWQPYRTVASLHLWQSLSTSSN